LPTHHARLIMTLLRKAYKAQTYNFQAVGE
jgi:hypothetical protein